MFGRLTLGGVLVTCLKLVVLWLWMAVVVLPARPGVWVVQAKPAGSYQQAMDRLADLQVKDDAGVDPACGSGLWTQGKKTAKVVVLLHGMYNCPFQYSQLAPAIFAKGEVNVLVPRIPHNGLLDKYTSDLSKTQTQEVYAFVDEVIDIAAGLGDQVVVMGLSVGGVLAGLAAWTREEVDRAVIIAPLLGINGLSVDQNQLVVNLFTGLPNVPGQYLMPFPEPSRHAYKGHSTRGIGVYLQLGFGLMEAADEGSWQAEEVVVVINQNDTVVSNARVWEFADLLDENPQIQLSVHVYPKELGLAHELLDPTHPRAKVDLVYPVLQELVLPGS